MAQPLDNPHAAMALGQINALEPGQRRQQVGLGIAHHHPGEARFEHGQVIETVAGGDHALRLDGQYLKQRQQFGKPLAQFQVLRHRVADMHIACEQARSMAQMASATLLLGHPARSANAAAAKAQAGWSARFVGQQAVQLHGGMGVSNELRVGHWFKRLMAIDILLGNADHQVRRFGELVSTS